MVSNFTSKYQIVHRQVVSVPKSFQIWFFLTKALDCVIVFKLWIPKSKEIPTSNIFVTSLSWEHFTKRVYRRLLTLWYVSCKRNYTTSSASLIVDQQSQENPGCSTQFHFVLIEKRLIRIAPWVHRILLITHQTSLA